MNADSNEPDSNAREEMTPAEEQAHLKKVRRRGRIFWGCVLSGLAAVIAFGMLAPTRHHTGGTPRSAIEAAEGRDREIEAAIAGQPR